MTRKEIRRTDRFAQLAVVACDEAMEQAGWAGGLPYDPARIACIVGSGIGGTEAAETAYLSQKPSPLTIPLMMLNAAAGFLAMRHGLHGPCFGTVSACSAGADAIGVALGMVRSGEADAAVTGGADAPLTEFAIKAFRTMEATSPTGISRPFDARRDGFVMGEGAGILLIEAEETAAKRGAEPLGELMGYGSSADAFHLVMPEPEGKGAARAMTNALGDAGIEPGRVDYINAHGTSTTLNDLAETRAIKLALGEHAGQVPISSAKSTIGHSLGAAGAVEAVAAVHTLKQRQAPPTLNYSEPDGELDLDYVPEGARELSPRNGEDRLVALSNSFGFGGHNSVLCLGGPEGTGA